MDTAEIPEYVFESLARNLLPVIQKYYESEDSKKAFAEWKAKKISDCASAALPVLSLPVFNFFHKNKKSEPMTNRYKVRIILHWWRRGESNPCPKTCLQDFLRA